MNIGKARRLAGFALFGFGGLFRGRVSDRAAVGFDPTQLVSNPQKQEQHQRQTDPPTQAVNRAVPLTVVLDQENQG